MSDYHELFVECGLDAATQRDVQTVLTTSRDGGPVFYVFMRCPTCGEVRYRRRDLLAVSRCPHCAQPLEYQSWSAHS